MDRSRVEVDETARRRVVEVEALGGGAGGSGATVVGVGAIELGAVDSVGTDDPVVTRIGGS